LVNQILVETKEIPINFNFEIFNPSQEIPRLNFKLLSMS
jgi:hypothetical protein